MASTKAIREAAELSREGSKSVEEAAAWLNVSVREMWRIIGEGHVILLERGRRRLIPTVSLQRYLAGLILDQALAKKGRLP